MKVELDLGDYVQDSLGLFYIQPLDSGFADPHCYIGRF